MADTMDLSYAALLGKADLFAGMDRVSLAQLTAHLESITLPPGGILFHQGDEGDALYVVAEGAIEIFLVDPDGQRETLLNTLDPGALLGEMALVTGEPRSASARARGPTCMLRLGRDRFLDLLAREPSVARSIISVLSERLRAADSKHQQSDLVARGNLDGLLEALAEEELRDLLWASVLPDPSPASLDAVFGEPGKSIAASLGRLDSAFPDSAEFYLQALRERLSRGVPGPELEDFLGTAGARLADAGLWDAACSVLAQRNDRAPLAATLGRALRADPPLGDQQALRWIDELTHQAMVNEPLVARLAAKRHEAAGEHASAHSLLQQATEAALVAGDTAAVSQLTEAISQLVTTAPSTDSPTRAAWARIPLPAALRTRWRPVAAVTITAAIICAVAGGFLVHVDPRLGFALFLASAIALWNSNAFPDFSVGLALIAIWVLTGIAHPQEALAGFATMDWLFVLSVLGLAVAVARSGLLYRAGLLLVQRSPARLAPQALALMVTGLLLSPLLPEPRGRAALTAPLAVAVADAFRLGEREPAAALLGLSAWIGSGPLMFLFLNASPVCLLAWGLLPQTERDNFDWLHWFLAALPLGLVVAAGTFVALFLILRPTMKSLPSRDRLTLQLAVLGPVTARERAMLAILMLTVVGWFVAPTTVHVGVIAVLGLFAAAAIGAFDQQSFREMDWGFLIYYGVALSMQKVSATMGVAAAAAGLLGAPSSPGGMILLVHPMVFIAIVTVTGLLARFFLEASQAVLLLALVFFPAAAALSVSPWLVAMALLATNNPWVTLKQSPAYQLAYVGSEGRLFSVGQGRMVALAYAGITLASLLLLAPYWRFLGLL